MSKDRYRDRVRAATAARFANLNIVKGYFASGAGDKVVVRHLDTLKSITVEVEELETVFKVIEAFG